ncbi:hypothetical protein UPYG_G00008300 [Umbra pygmaea]|uniref:Uncharacterized protein n=1 Tax=Umbra pygmaea TaxID=75934 RepID=A0ABD0Y741_UMBPY
MNPESLDWSIQNTLSVLYPPFEATASNVLSQLFQVIDECYQGDALECFLDFLIPARHILESVQQAACAQYSEGVYRCEGWPLCLHEKVVIQLAPISLLWLRPGDFYLQVAPFSEQAARIVVRSLLEEQDGRGQQVEETPIPETSYPCIFTEDWLLELNHGRNGTPLRQCILTTDQGIVKVPWAQVALPEFVDKPKTMASTPGPPATGPLEVVTGPGPSFTLPPPSPGYSVQTRISPAKHGIAVSLRLVDISCSGLVKLDQHGPVAKPIGWVSPTTWDSRNTAEAEGEYVDLVELSMDKEPLNGGTCGHTQPRVPMSVPVPLNRPGVPPAPPLPPALAPHPPFREPSHCGRAVRFSEEPPCTPCLRRRVGQASKAQELRCRYRESYHSALQNPVTFDRDSRLSTLVVLDEASPCEGRLEPESKQPCPGPSQHSCRPDAGITGQPPSASTASIRESQQGNSISSRAIPGLSDTLEDTGRCPSSLSTTVVETSEKCDLVIQGRKVLRDINSSTEMIPSLHVMKCRNATAFGLVSPKINRRRLPNQDISQAGQTSMSIGNRHQTSPLAAPPETSQQGPGYYAVSRSNFQPPASAESSTHPLWLGIACLTGGRDRTGRSVVEVYGDHEGWMSPVASSLELCKLLRYLHSVIRKEQRELGMTLVIDARKTPPLPQFETALLMVEDQAPHAVQSVLVLLEKESYHCPQKSAVVTSLKALHKLVEGGQLTSGLGGSLPYCHTDWLQFHKKLYPFMSDLQDTSGLLLQAIDKLEEDRNIGTVQAVQKCISDQRTLMKNVLEDSRLVGLQREGGAMLARLRRESDVRYSHCEDYRYTYSDAVDSATSLYNHVEEQAHVLVKKSNMSLEHLEYLLQLRQMEDHFTKIRDWFDVEGEQRLQEADSVEDSRDRVEQTLQSFKAFLTEVNEQKQQAMALVTEAETTQRQALYPETELFRTLVDTFKSGLADFLSRAEQRCSDLEAMVTVCNFCQQATELAKDCRQYLDQKLVGRHLEMDDVSTLQIYQESFVQFSPERFQEVKALACALRGSRGMRVWNVAWLKCQEVRQQLEETLQDVERALRNTDCWHEPYRPRENEALFQTVTHHYRSLLLPRPEPPECNSPPSESVEGRSHGASENSVDCSNMNFKPENQKPGKGLSVSASPHTRSPRRTEKVPRRREASRGETREAATCSDSHPVGCEWFPWQHRGLSRSVSDDSCATATSSQSEACIQTPSCYHGQPSCRILQAAQKFQISRHGSFCSEESCAGQGEAKGASSQNTNSSIRRCKGTTLLASPEDAASSVVKLQRIMEELLYTEREYVRSLGYILTHYLPLLEMPDVPQDLRGKRGVIFGNLEKLYDFHRHLFLRELEACQSEPLRVARCFLRHRDSLGLYALYSKNKPQSDALILHHHNDIFKTKQQELGDHMDLSSYLLRPIQRISKYSLLLQDMLGVYGPQLDVVRAELQAAVHLIRFQMRHGNDLLTMDAIQECDVNLKEQGQLIRQDDFIVFFRKKKCFRRIFLFQDLILFSKTKKTEMGNDVYMYKQSFKTSDIGMTHNSGESGRCFEIWFRRRKSQDTYTLKADREELKRAWTRDLEQILWEQAAYSRELCIQERVFMGMGRNDFMDIEHSEAAVSERTANCGRQGGTPVPCCHQTDMEHLRPNSIGSGSSASTSCSHSSSSSGRGSLPPVISPVNQKQDGQNDVIFYSSPENVTVTEDDLKNHRKQNHLLINSTESSSVTFQSSQQHVQDSSAAPNHRKSSSPAIIRKKPSIAPKPPGLGIPQGQKKVKVCHQYNGFEFFIKYDSTPKNVLWISGQWC